MTPRRKDNNNNNKGITAECAYPRKSAYVARYSWVPGAINGISTAAIRSHSATTRAKSDETTGRH